MLFILLIMLWTSLGSIAFASPTLSITVQVDSDNVTLGDRIVLTGRITNNGEELIRDLFITVRSSDPSLELLEIKPNYAVPLLSSKDSIDVHVTLLTKNEGIYALSLVAFTPQGDIFESQRLNVKVNPKPLPIESIILTSSIPILLVMLSILKRRELKRFAEGLGARLYQLDSVHILGLLLVGSLVVLTLSAPDWISFLSGALQLKANIPDRIFLLVWSSALFFGLPALGILASRAIKYRRSSYFVLGLSFLGYRTYSFGVVSALLSGHASVSYIAEFLAWNTYFAGSLILIAATGSRLSKSNRLSIVLLLVGLALWFAGLYLRGGLYGYLALLRGELFG